ncbi:MAG: rRNA maturation RNase YbeY [Dictyoglomus sp.]|nr:rRNA maturation RNase YbeY [Dictyoglomus sp.]MCX7941677.1 rRNA maturation RNase YbeY [Dictyoglomaceae bacterium]MDW8188171.1 rRNA maturation RNase YbeY [Dictyoglomus sp.]
MSLEIYNLKEGLTKKDNDKLKMFLKEILRKKGLLPKNYDISVVFVDDEKIRELNKKYRNKDKPTDVLSFNLGKDPKGRIIGEIYISISTAEKQCLENNRSLLDEIAFLSLHGLLHILGYDHENLSEREKMDKETQNLLKYWV